MSFSNKKAIKEGKQQLEESNKKIAVLEGEKAKLTNSCKEIERKLGIAEK